MVKKKQFRLRGFISLEEINLSRQKQNYRFYLFDNSWYFPTKHVIFIYLQLFELLIIQSKISFSDDFEKYDSAVA